MRLGKTLLALCLAAAIGNAFLAAYPQNSGARGDDCAQAAGDPRGTPVNFDNVLYGAAYYSEYAPYDRLDKDVALMQQAGLSVVRMGESTWSLWEPEDGQFEYAWMDRVVDAMGKADIKVILGTPTYSIPTWQYREHPEVMVRLKGGERATYGMRQTMDSDNPAFRFYAQRLIEHLAEHYRDNPTVIGWQIDNETSSMGATNEDVFVGFVNHLKQKFGTTENMNKAWGLNYWGQDVHGWENMPTPDAANNTGYKLEWSRWSQMRVTGYLSWQAALFRKHARPDQFVTQDFSGSIHRDTNEFEVAKSLDIVSANIYHDTQDHMDGAIQAELGDFYRSLKRCNFLVTETNAQTTGWDSSSQYPLYDGQLRLNVYTDLASGANMVEYWHWASIPSGQETYWKGVLGHDFEPNRAYAEVSRTAHELKKVGPRLVDLKIKNDVAILYSVDSFNALDFMPFTHGGNGDGPPVDYRTLLDQLHRSIYGLNVGTDFVFPEEKDFSRYRVLIVPALYISNDALLDRISAYVKNGGHVLMTFKSGFANENSAVRWVRAPGPLRDAAGFSYQEFSNLETPLSLKGDPFHAGAGNQVSAWAEFLIPEHAQALAYYDHPFFGRWPAITENHYGAGTLTYEGTYLSNALQRTVLLSVLKEAGLTGPDQDLPTDVHVRHGTNRMGKKLHYYMNYSSSEQSFRYPCGAATELLSGAAVASSQTVALKPWDLAIMEEQ